MPDIADVAWSERDDRNSEGVPAGWPQGAMPAYVDQTGRMMMGATKRFWNKINPVYQTTGSGDTYVVQTEVGIDQINLYEILRVRIDRSNTGTTPMLQFGATNPRTIVKAGTSGYIPLGAGDMLAGNDHSFWYNGAFYILSDPAVSSSGTYQPSSANLTSWAAITRAAGFDTFAGTPLAANMAAFLAGGTSAQLAAAVSGETGSGGLVFATSPTLITPALGTPSALVLTNATGTPSSIGLANGTGLPVSGVSGLAANMAAFLAGGTSAQLIAAVSDETGSGSLVFATSPTLVSPALGTPSSLVLTNATGLPVAGGGTGASSAANARTNLGLVIGTDVQAFDAQLSSLIRQNSQSAAYTLVLTDAGKHIFHPSADTTARIWTIPANASVAYPIGTVLTFVNQNGAGVITIAITTDTMRLVGAGTTGSRTLAANGQATALKVTSTEWQISGAGLT